MTQRQLDGAEPARAAHLLFGRNRTCIAQRPEYFCAIHLGIVSAMGRLTQRPSTGLQ